ncbi:MAG: hypothetical protein CMI60_04210 [Parvibaculum sp.]|jgi:DNA-directed RNA polymerase specialized sigma24 family protein|nr:hypothetical protein [Parvibaculum sp.]|tara:strand:- start:489 stop:914 length:426 start_codon:yes stop_codon:yes gene_type:complete
MTRHIIEWLAGLEGCQIFRISPCRRAKKAQDKRSDCYFTAGHSTGDGHAEDGGGHSGPINPDDFDERELKEILHELIGTLIELLDPRYAEVVKRAEILDQPSCQIADEMNLSEQEVAIRLQAGRRALLHLVLLTLQPHLQE